MKTKSIKKKNRTKIYLHSYWTWKNAKSWLKMPKTYSFLIVKFWCFVLFSLWFLGHTQWCWCLLPAKCLGFTPGGVWETMHCQGPNPVFPHATHPFCPLDSAFGLPWWNSTGSNRKNELLICTAKWVTLKTLRKKRVIWKSA